MDNIMTPESFRERSLVVESNPLIRCRRYMSAEQQKIFLLALQDINPHMSENDKMYDVNFRRTFIPSSKLKERFGNGWYLTRMREDCFQLSRTVLEEYKSDGGFKFTGLFEQIEFKPGEGLYVQFSEAMRPFLLELIGQKYTQIPIKEVFCLSSSYAIRLVELLLQGEWLAQKRKQKVITAEISVDDLRHFLNIPPKAYKQMCNFRTNVLDKPIAEINKKTCYRITYQTVKTGRKVTAFSFVMDISRKDVPDGEIIEAVIPPKKTSYVDGFDEASQNLWQRMVNIGNVSQKEAAKLIKQYGYDVCHDNFEYIRKQQSSMAKKLSGGLVRSAIVDDYAGRAEAQRVRDQQHEREKERREKEAHEFFHGKPAKIAQSKDQPDKSQNDDKVLSCGLTVNQVRELQAIFNPDNAFNKFMPQARKDKAMERLEQVGLTPSKLLSIKL